MGVEQKNIGQIQIAYRGNGNGLIPIGDEVFYMDVNQIKKSKINHYHGIVTKNNDLKTWFTVQSYRLENEAIISSEFGFPTRESLIDSL